jgi:hypothetical protein
VISAAINSYPSLELFIVQNGDASGYDSEIDPSVPHLQVDRAQVQTVHYRFHLCALNPPAGSISAPEGRTAPMNPTPKSPKK